MSPPDEAFDPSGAAETRPEEASASKAVAAEAPPPPAGHLVSLRFPEPAVRPYPLGPALLPRTGRPEEEEDPFAGLTAIGPTASERKIRDHSLVLQSMSMWHVIRRTYAGWVLLVRDADYPTASRSIDRYEEENRDWPPRPVRERPRHPSSPVTPIIFLALVAFFFVTGPVTLGSRWFTHGTAVTAEILSGRPWEAVTALTLHADSTHVLGNAISGTVFASAVHRRLGPGGSALAILATGILGNLGNALWHRSLGDLAHRSIGASTAVFGAIGLLAATQVVIDGLKRKSREQRSWTDVAAPLVGGLALLGTLGAGGPTTDLGAHLFGFLAGVAVGLLVAFPLRRSSLAVDFGSRRAGHAVALGSGAPNAWVQVVLGATALGIVAGAWELAFRH